MNKTNCWCCKRDFEYDGKEYQDVNCPHCEVQNSIYDPKDYQPIPPEAGEGEEMAIPLGSNNFSPFLKLPNPLENKDGEIKVNDKVLILEELQAPNSDKIKSPLIGEVELTSGLKRTIGLNWTSYYSISKIYGADTKDWVGKFLTYHGLKKMDKGTGHLWTASA